MSDEREIIWVELGLFDEISQPCDQWKWGLFGPVATSIPKHPYFAWGDENT